MARLGIKAKCYFLPTGTRATWGVADADNVHNGPAPAALQEMPQVKDLTLNLSKGEADATTRGSGGWKVILAGLKEGSIEFEMLWEPADTAFQAFFKAWLTDSNIAVAALDGDKAAAGSQGLWADFQVTGFVKKEPLNEPQSVSITLKPGYSAVAPEWVKVAGA